ncbi:hypothetical protein [Marivirga arenosa]|uniref:Uncharacterized protein n=1 Tax=Marivirga arenosa TaxID=3059076 RepID=A0AA51ZX47_9BACT|nr:hypothetical protein [Marivirga sp. BKB1-2]WNB18311.1 hypothetical protein QYS47_29865 [Marivirga sp. BKB1-2]
MRKEIFVICLYIFLVNSAQSQLNSEILVVPKKEIQKENFAVGKIDITTPLNKSLKDYLQITDTIDLINNKIDVLKIEGLLFSFAIKIHRDSTISEFGNKRNLYQESKFSPYQLWNYDITNLNSTELRSVAQALNEKRYDTIVLRNAYQTCISYSLESIFRSHGIDPEPYFFRRSVIPDFTDTNTILKQMFIHIETLQNLQVQTLKKSKNLWKNQIIILFRNESGNPIHACFNLYGRTWTKNGLLPYFSYSSPYSVIETYNSATSIEIYQLNENIFN